MIMHLVNRLKQPSKILMLALLAAIVIGITPSASLAQQAPVPPAQYYAGIIAGDPGARGYEAVYWELIRQGKQPLDAYRATYVYEQGYRIGYYYGFILVTLNGQQPADGYDSYFTWLQFYQSQEWSKPLWGWFQQAYLDGQLRGNRVARRLEAVPAGGGIPAPAAGDVGAYQRSLPAVDPNDPWSDLRIRQQITGPR